MRPGEIVEGAGILVLLGGVGVWIWGGQWRWAATGLLVFTAAMLVGAVLDRGAGR